MKAVMFVSPTVCSYTVTIILFYTAYCVELSSISILAVDELDTILGAGLQDHVSCIYVVMYNILVYF